MSMSRAPILVATLALLACNSDGNATPSPDGSVANGDGAVANLDGSGGGCSLTAHTTPTGKTQDGCALVTRDTSACRAARQAAGLSGAWLAFSCRVTITPGASTITLTSDDQPDHTSNYFPTTNPCYAPYAPSFPDPNSIAAQHLSVTVPTAPDTTTQAMRLGPVGIAVDGVAIFDNQAAPGDDIFNEVGSFDECQGHPQMSGAYHYHTEPYAISVDDDALIGVLADGYLVYGRRDSDGSVPTLDAAGGHTGPTPDSGGAPVYHHHLVLQTDTTGTNAGKTAWFLTTGTYAGTPGATQL